VVLALLAAHHIFHISRIKVKSVRKIRRPNPALWSCIFAMYCHKTSCYQNFADYKERITTTSQISVICDNRNIICSHNHYIFHLSLACLSIRIILYRKSFFFFKILNTNFWGQKDSVDKQFGKHWNVFKLVAQFWFVLPRRRIRNLTKNPP
jgi:hypothetical protein